MTLQGIRPFEGEIQAYYKGHNNAISVIKLDDDERAAISGSWDKTVVDWDLETEKPRRTFAGAQGQISSLEWQPVGGSYVPKDLGESSLKFKLKETVDTADGKIGKVGSNGSSKNEQEEDDDDMDSLFGDDEEEGSANEGQKNGVGTDGDIKMEDGEEKPKMNNTNSASSSKKSNEISHSVFLASSIDGIVDIWDRRQEKRVARIRPHEGVPPWTASACWSTDGNSIYVGRRNSCVDEYQIAKSFQPYRTFKFPTVSGPVSCVKPMPSGRHLLCASHDNLRIYDLKQSMEDSAAHGSKQPITPFYIIPGHHGGVISSIFIDPACQYMVTASGGRGWMGSTTDVALVYEITGIP